MTHPPSWAADFQNLGAVPGLESRNERRVDVDDPAPAPILSEQ
jgi:hypothetical protein